ncbi:hypothetical protein [Rhizobium sp. ZW T2_16]|uniref:hypothetical protein n=1 Tax=Rhizobium sp. ZW T2_16 TaxID=3378083 RepID=UPI00385371AA
MATNDFFIEQLEHRIGYLEEHPDHLYSAGAMQVLLGDQYEAYASGADVSLQSTAANLSDSAEDWSRRANKLLVEVNRALNLGHVTIEPATSAQQQRAEAFRDRAEQLMDQYDNNIRGTADEGGFSEPAFEYLGPEDRYYEAQRLLEYWVIPLRQQNTPGIDKRDYLRHLQSESLRAELDALTQAPATTQSQQASPRSHPNLVLARRFGARRLLD